MNERRNRYDQPIGPPVEGWCERDTPQRSAHAGRYCRLEPVDVAHHAEALFDAYMRAPDERDWTYLLHARPHDLPAFSDYLTALAASQDPLHYAIVDLASGRALGTAALMRVEPRHGVIEVGYITYSPPLKGTRSGTEAMYLLMRYVFDALRYRRYEWKCDSLNAPSRAAARRYGFAFEGIFRNATMYKGHSRDTAWFSIIDSEWPRIRTAFETWLDPRNFDSLGRQRRALAAIRDAL